MSAFERLLVPGCTELPACRCGKEMQIASLDQLPGRSDAYVRVYNCPACHHERRLTVWATDTAAQRPRRLADAPPVEKLSPISDKFAKTGAEALARS
jgi:hypothetical protein